MKLHISTSVSKLGSSIPSINLPAIITCRPDAPCYKQCYARKGCFNFKHNRELLMGNLELWQTNPVQFEFEASIGVALSMYTRWHSSGDIPDSGYFEMMVRIAEERCNTNFLAFTKKYEIVNAYLDENEGRLPDNLTVVFSAWGDEFQPHNPYNLPVAYIRFKDKQTTIPEDAHECSGNCGQCAAHEGSCWHLKRGESVVFNQH